MGVDRIIPLPEYTPIQVNQLFDAQVSWNINEYQDLVAKEESVNLCIANYVAKQERSFSKITQGNLYDLMRNFSKVISRVDGKKPSADSIPYDEKIKTLARVQCEAYYAIGVMRQ